MQNSRGASEARVASRQMQYLGGPLALLRAKVVGLWVPFLITVPPYGGGGFLAVDAAARRLYGLEATFEYGTVAAFHFDFVDHASMTSCFDYDALFASNDYRQARVAGRGGCEIPVITDEHFISIAIAVGELPHRDRRQGTSIRRESKQDRCQPVFVESNDTGVAHRRSHFRDRHSLHPDITLRIEIERRRWPKAFHIAELPLVVWNFEFHVRAGHNEFRHGWE
jgi:hypothetical protein